MATRLAPTVSPDTQFFWKGLRDHKLLIQHCTDCGALRHPARPMCPHCNSLDWDTVESSGRGTVYSYVMPQHPRMHHCYVDRDALELRIREIGSRPRYAADIGSAEIRVLEVGVVETSAVEIGAFELGTAQIRAA